MSRPSFALVAAPLLLAAVGLSSTSVLADDPAATAEYELTFDAVWSAETHPIDFPSTAHWSGMIGGTHNDSISFWELGGIASHAIERMAENGSKTELRIEVLTAIGVGSAGSVIEGNGFQAPGSRTISFEATQEFNLATVVAMIAPSPDWFIGVSGHPLFVDGHWIPELVVELYPYDAGTQTGSSYTGASQDVTPHEPISLRTGLPFADKGEPIVPLGTFLFRRLGAPPCPGDVDDSGLVDVSDLVQVLADWGPCDECPSDVDGDGEVGVQDLLAVLSTWGACG